MTLMEIGTFTLTDLLGLAAACMTTAAFVPQALLIWKTKRADSVSFGMYSIFACGVALWLAYGVAIDAWPIVAANAVTLALTVFILAMKIRYK